MARAQNGFVSGQGYTKEDWDDVSDNPEWTAEEIAQAKPFAEVFPELAESIRRQRGPQRTKAAISIRLDDDIVAKLRESGPGWQSRVNDAIRAWLDKGVT
ncbi:BrnA antitoxin family protein [Hansschlegelia plantiphila]|uniref:BrnA antitoxin family protein n=1 Tax=Hansschlegelia plantiphila TaxID=374655 RepID=A0A9W6J2I4_9HYPH|nr:BrnA antitoxin family protein [Hansschlegelia plantiphila]GLK69660.1 hypothetical protein GCM10008179_32980 [Hansschlegelia plantiphila]